jgi:hypothetical protein
MLSLPAHPLPTRRNLLRNTSGTGLLLLFDVSAFAASDFWNKKDSSAWSSEEMEQLKTRSPWARKIRAEMAGGRGGGRGGAGSGGADSMDSSGSKGTFGGMSGADSNGISVGGSGRGGGGGRGRGRDGGAPASEASPQEDPAARQKAMIDRLVQSATLTARGRDPQTADMVRQAYGNQTLIFGFSKQSFPLTAADKDVQFVIKLGPLLVKAKFEPKDMSYKGELSL